MSWVKSVLIDMDCLAGPEDIKVFLAPDFDSRRWVPDNHFARIRYIMHNDDMLGPGNPAPFVSVAWVYVISFFETHDNQGEARNIGNMISLDKNSFMFR